MPEELDAATKLSMFMAASPFYVDLDDPNEKDTIADRSNSLPQNIQNVLIAEETAAKIWNLAVVKHGFSVDQVKQVARALRDILMGRESAATLRATMQQRLNASAAVTDDIVRALTQDLISPNYFQIAQLYERNQRKQQTESSRRGGGPMTAGGSAGGASAAVGSRGPNTPGRPLETLGPRDDRPAPSPLRPTPPSAPPPKNLVDLRGSRRGGGPMTAGGSAGGASAAVGSRDETTSTQPPSLPPTPPPAPRPAGTPSEEEPPATPPAPQPPIPRGPLTDRPTHGPLPPPPRV